MSSGTPSIPKSVSSPDLTGTANIGKEKSNSTQDITSVVKPSDQCHEAARATKIVLVAAVIAGIVYALVHYQCFQMLGQFITEKAIPYLQSLQIPNWLIIASGVGALVIGGGVVYGCLRLKEHYHKEQVLGDLKN